MSPITGKVFVSGVTFDPPDFFTGDKGTVTYVVINSNTNTSVMLNHGTFYDNNFRLLSETYDFSNTLGPLQSRPFTFSILADAPAGDYYPSFSLSFYDGNLYHKSLVQIDNTPLQLTVIDQPDAYTPETKKTVYMQVANPRNNMVRNVVLELNGDGADFAPSRVFVGNLGPGEKISVNFSVTPYKATPLKLTLNYNNGDNPHTIFMEMPIIFGVNKKAANPVMSNVLVKTDAGVYHVTGDVNNAGLETANTVMVTSLAPAVPQDPYKTYVVGALKPDDFGSFEVTFTAGPGNTSVPIQLSYKDADGNIYNSVQDVKISSSGLSTSETNGSSNMLPVAAAIVIVLIFVSGWVYYLRRNKK
ncbi:MAG: hypothetical protein WCB46_10800 [Methanoregula sp.]